MPALQLDPQPARMTRQDARLSFLEEKAFAHHSRKLGPHGETTWGCPRRVSLSVHNESRLTYKASARGLSLTPLKAPFVERNAFVQLGRFSVGGTYTSPAIIQGVVDQGATVFTFAATECDARKAERFTTNGMSTPGYGLLVAGDGASYRLVASQAWNCLHIIYWGALADTGWPLDTSEARILPISAARWALLRNIVCDIFSIALQDERFFEAPRVAAGADENLQLLLDEALKDLDAAGAPTRPTKRSFAISQRVEAYLSENLGKPIYNDEICRDLGISARVLHDAVVAVMQMPLQRYLKLKRLWGVRHVLLNSPSDMLVKSVALDFGFWHLARFSAEYASFFGESPSQTRKRARPWQSDADPA